MKVALNNTLSTPCDITLHDERTLPTAIQTLHICGGYFATSIKIFVFLLLLVSDVKYFLWFSILYSCNNYFRQRAFLNHIS